MLWFQHKSDAIREEEVASFLHECRNPLEAYGFWNRLQEIVAAQIKVIPEDEKQLSQPEDLKNYCEYALSQWSHELYCHHHTVSKYLGKLEGNGLVTVENVGSKIRVTIPKLLESLDDYTKKVRRRSKQSTNNVRQQNNTTQNNTSYDGSTTATTSPGKQESGSAILAKACEGAFK